MSRNDARKDCDRQGCTVGERAAPAPLSCPPVGHGDAITERPGLLA